MPDSGSAQLAEVDVSDPRAESNYLRLTQAPLPVDEMSRWVNDPGAGAVVVFLGTVRDHSENREGVVSLEYEAYEDEAARRLEQLAQAVRIRWPVLIRLAIAHRLGVLAVGEPSVLVAVSTPHRAQAFDAAEWCIDTLKATLPIWKRETWAGGSDWGQCAHGVDSVPAPAPAAQP
ncbi:MAG: molybdenum cofactor biosynthesis protein MoaE [Acidimicrobiales bacterium]